MTTEKKKGVSLAKGPVALVGLALLAYGVTAFIFGGHSFSADPIGGTVNGKTWLGLEVNAWSSLLFIGAGLLLLFGAPLHWGAKGLSLFVGLVLGAAALIALYDKQDVFGIFAANSLTKLVWGAAAVVLLILALLPRVGAKSKQRDEDAGTEPTPDSRRVQRERRAVEREPVAEERVVRFGREDPASNDSPPRRGQDGGVVAPASGTTPESRDTTRRQRNQDG